jgi:hypothetical protein
MRKRSNRGRGRPAKITPAQELAILHARELDPPVAWKDLMAEYDCSRSVLNEALHRAKVRISGHNSLISGHQDDGHGSPAA